MDFQKTTIETFCRPDLVSGYLDGELTLLEEEDLDSHFGICKTCLDELNLQKKVLSALDYAFNDKIDGPEFVLPKNFARVVTVTAESSVTGLKCRKERFRALWLCLALLLFGLIGLGAETGKILAWLSAVSEKIVAVLSVGLHLFYDFVVGIGVVGRGLSVQIVFSPAFLVLLLFCMLVFFAAILSRYLFDHDRT